jgi:D-alanine--poly(phosphoribitol) ligase subunit 2
MNEKVLRIILDSIEIINQNLENRLPIDQLEACGIYNGPDGLDSISLVALISLIEDSVETKLGFSITLANEKAMSMRNSPFRNVGVLTVYICELINAEGKVV